MQITIRGGTPDRARIGWWLFVLALGAAFAFVFYSFIGTFLLGIFAYYATRPAYRRIRPSLPSDEVAAVATSLGVFLPLLAFIAYAAIAIAAQLMSQHSPVAVRQFAVGMLNFGSPPNAQADLLAALADHPIRALSNRRDAVAGLVASGTRFLELAGLGLMHMALALTLAFYLIRYDDSIGALIRRTVGGTDTTAYAYATAVDRDLEYIFYRNVVFVIAMGVLAAVVYTGANYFAPAGLAIPLPIVLAALTGISSLIPIVVSKVVYVPLALYLGYQATTMETSLFFPAAILVVSFVLLDILPQTVLQPYITGRRFAMGLMLFAYLLGPLLFGWYGFFLLPVLLVLGIQALRIVVEELVHGEPLSPRIQVGRSIGSDPATGGSETDTRE